MIKWVYKIPVSEENGGLQCRLGQIMPNKKDIVSRLQM